MCRGYRLGRPGGAWVLREWSVGRTADLWLIAWSAGLLLWPMRRWVGLMYGRRGRFVLRFLMHGRLMHGRCWRWFRRVLHSRRLHHRWLRNGLRSLRLREQAATTTEAAAAGRAAASRAATA